MLSRVSFVLIALAVVATCPGISAVESQNGCPITKAPERPFIPPPPLDTAEDGSFVLGTAGLWTRVTTHWLLRQTGRVEDVEFPLLEVDNPPT